MAYICKVNFCDMEDNNYVYHAGDKYPRMGYTPAERRIKQLLSAANALGVSAIAIEREVAENAEKQAETKPAEKKPKTTARTSRRTK